MQTYDKNGMATDIRGNDINRFWFWEIAKNDDQADTCEDSRYQRSYVVAHIGNVEHLMVWKTAKPHSQAVAPR